MPTDDAPAGFTYASGLTIGRAVSKIMGAGRSQSPIAKRPRHIASGKGGSGGDIMVALIDADIDGVEEDEDAKLDDGAVVYQDPVGTVIDELSLRCYERRKVDLKYYRLAVDGDPGFEVDKIKMILVTEEAPDDPTDEASPLHTQYATRPVLFDEGDSEKFTVGSYGRGEYTDYDGDEWPPLKDGGPEQIDADKFKCRFRALCFEGKDKDGNKVWISGTIFCAKLPKPTLESLGYVAPE